MSVHDCPCFLLGLAHRKLVKAYEEALAPLNLTIAQAHFLSVLFARDGQVCRELATELGVDAGTLTPMIDRLVRQGLVRRCPDPDDRRATRLCLEPAGRRLEPEISGRTRAVLEAFKSRFTEAEYVQFYDLVGRVADPDGREAASYSSCP